MKKNKLSAAFSNNMNYKTIAEFTTKSIDEEVKNVMRVNRFVGEYVGAITKDRNFFTESEARALLKLDTNSELVKDGIGHIGDNVVVMGFKNKLTIEAQIMMVEGLMKID